MGVHNMKAAYLFSVLVLITGCGRLEQNLFPIWEENYFEIPPAAPGPFAIEEKRVHIEDGADGEPFGITVFAPVDAEGPLPVFIWVMGSNVQAYYHQSLHELLASWGYLVLAPDTRPLLFTDLKYHSRIVLLAEQTLTLALTGAIGHEVDVGRIAVGGYSVGGPLAAFTAARSAPVSAIVYWAPSGSPIWQGLRPRTLYPLVNAASLYILGELDDNAPAEGGYPDKMQAAMPAPFEAFVIEGASHHQFQQPTGADQFSNTPEISRETQQGIAITKTREWLDAQFAIIRN